MRITGNEGAQYAIEATGVAPAMEAAFGSLGFRGTMIQIGDAGTGAGTVSMTPGQFLAGGKKIMGCLEGESVPPDFIPKLVEMFYAGDLPVDIISKQYPWRNIQQAIDDMHKGVVVKPILVFD